MSLVLFPTAWPPVLFFLHTKCYSCVSIWVYHLGLPNGPGDVTKPRDFTLHPLRKPALARFCQYSQILTTAVQGHLSQVTSSSFPKANRASIRLQDLSRTHVLSTLTSHTAKLKRWSLSEGQSPPAAKLAV